MERVVPRYSNPRLEAIITNWPSGSMRTTATFRVETQPGRGQRGTRFTINPKTGRPSATKVMTYSHRVRIVDGDDGKIYLIEHTPAYRHISVMQGNVQFCEETIYSDDPRYAEVMKLFDVDVYA